MSSTFHLADPLEVVTDTPGQAENLRLRAELMTAIIGKIKDQKLTQRAAAEQAGVTAPRMSDLCAGRIDKFSLDALVNIGAALGIRAAVAAC